MNVPALPSETSVQLAAGLKPPAPLVPNATEPLGSLLPPADSVSVTVAVHVESSETTTDAGEQTTTVEVDLVLTDSAKSLVVLLSWWVASLAE